MNQKGTAAKDATKSNILKAKEKLMQSKVDDEVIVFVACHGMLDKNLDYYLATSNIDFYSPEKNGLAYNDLEGLLDGIPARKKLLLMDACHSGEVDKPEYSNTTFAELPGQEIKTGVVKMRAFKPIKQANSSNDKNDANNTTSAFKPMGLENSFELMKELFTDLRRGSGAMVISSAGGGEFAFEGNNWQNGVFTYCLIDGLKTGKADQNGDNTIPYAQQDTVQRLKAFKEGYDLWDRTFPVMPDVATSVILRKKE